MTKTRLAFLLLFLVTAVVISSLLMKQATHLTQEVQRSADEPDTLTTVFSLRPAIRFHAGETIEDNIHTRSVREHLNIDIHYLWTAPDSTFTTKLKLQLLNKREMPDIIPVRTDVVHELIDSGQFMAVDELFAQYASPVWKKAMKEDPAVWQPYERDGKHYAIPILDYHYNSDPVMWIREDWLEKVGLTPPSSLSELEAVLDAFTHRDPDGNGRDDTYGIAVSLQRAVNTWMADIGWVFGMYGILPEQWNLVNGTAEGEGRLEYGSIQPEAKQGLLKLKEWKEQGYFSDEALYQDEEMAARMFTQGKAGIVVGPAWMRYRPLDDMLAANSGVSFMAIPLPSGQSGKSYHRSSPPRNGAILINKNIQDPEPFFRYINYLYESGSVQAGPLNSLIPGEPVDVSDYTLIYDGARVPSDWTQIVSEPEKSILARQAGSRLLNEFQGPPTTTMREKWGQLQQTEREVFLQIIYGKQDIAYFDRFAALWKENGGDQITDEVNAWYRSSQSSAAAGR
ncbi:extracellular solute-binding protein [Paenibacillus sambharensis]|nr:extracellular solute-binding protein [Paenibacillus sambharensis]